MRTGIVGASTNGCGACDREREPAEDRGSRADQALQHDGDAEREEAEDDFERLIALATGPDAGGGADGAGGLRSPGSIGGLSRKNS